MAGLIRKEGGDEHKLCHDNIHILYGIDSSRRSTPRLLLYSIWPLIDCFDENQKAD